MQLLWDSQSGSCSIGYSLDRWSTRAIKTQSTFDVRNGFSTNARAGLQDTVCRAEAKLGSAHLPVPRKLPISWW